jgi:hypothetical protein
MSLSENVPLNLTKGQHLWLVGASDPVEDLACNGRPMTQFFLTKHWHTLSHIHGTLLVYELFQNCSYTVTSEGLGQTVGIVEMGGILLYIYHK